MEVMIVDRKFKADERSYNPGEVYVVTNENKQVLQRRFKYFAEKNCNPKLLNTAKFTDIDLLIKKATIEIVFSNLLIFRAGGIGDLIALTSIIDYFSDCNIHFVTQSKYFDLFEWFVDKPKVYDIEGPFIRDLSQSNLLTKYSNWAKFQGEGVIESGHNRNWFELFFSFVGENQPDLDMLRPQLKTDRISNELSNIHQIQIDNIESPCAIKKSLLICNKATAMMRSINVMDIIESLPDRIIDGYEIFVYENNLSEPDKYHLPDYIKVIGKTDLKTFLLDCYDADHMICVDTGSLHFREGINKPAIGLYNSFTADSRTKYYQYTKSFDIKSDCELQPCFLHETLKTPFCKKGTAGMFAAPCFNSTFNKKLNEQLTKIFNENL